MDLVIVIIIDYSQVAISNIIMQMSMVKNLPRVTDTDPVGAVPHFDAGMVRHMVLNSIREIIRKYKGKYGTEIVLAIDDRSYWRRTFFPPYKANRKKARESSQWDWEQIFKYMDMVKAELIENFPYKVIQVAECEADDVVAILCQRFGKMDTSAFGDLASTHSRILIVSGDKDFGQLQIYDNVDQYSPQSNKMIRENAPITLLKNHIIKGDTGDGVPNILSPDDTFISGGRQRPIRNEYLKKWATIPPDQFCDNEDMRRNWKRNEMLIDLSKIPVYVQERVNTAYDECRPAPRMKMFNYFIKHKLKELHSAINDF
jgi:hypothetical protein